MVSKVNLPDGVGDRAFPCGVCMFSLWGRYPHKNTVILVSIMPPPGQPGRLMEGKGNGWNNVFLPRATSKTEKSPLSGEKKKLGLLMHRRKHEVSPLSPQARQRESRAQDYIGNWHWVKNGFQNRGIKIIKIMSTVYRPEAIMGELLICCTIELFC